VVGDTYHEQGIVVLEASVMDRMVGRRVPHGAQNGIHVPTRKELKVDVTSAVHDIEPDHVEGERKVRLHAVVLEQQGRDGKERRVRETLANLEAVARGRLGVDRRMVILVPVLVEELPVQRHVPPVVHELDQRHVDQKVPQQTLKVKVRHVVEVANVVQHDREAHIDQDAQRPDRLYNERERERENEQAHNTC